MAYGAVSVIGESETGDNSQWMVQNVQTQPTSMGTVQSRAPTVRQHD